MTLGLLAGVATWWSMGLSQDHTAEARLRLIEDEVRWPFHQSVIEAQQGYLRDDTVRADIAEIAGVAVDQVLDLSSDVPRGTVAFGIRATAPTSDDAVALADAAATWAVENNLEERTEVLAAEREAASQRATVLGLEVDRQLELLETDPGTMAELSLAGALNRKAETEDLISSLTDEIVLRQPQLARIGQAQLDESTGRREASAAAVGLGVTIMGLAAWGGRDQS